LTLIERLTFYDAVGKGGAGISSKAFDFIDLLLQQAFERVEVCGCRNGCLECITSPICKEGNIVTSKIGAFVILKSLLNLDIDISILPEGDEKGTHIETVVPVTEQVREADEIRRYPEHGN
jgi:DEAD/DEAH box helicase domain-containing protein